MTPDIPPPAAQSPPVADRADLASRGPTGLRRRKRRKKSSPLVLPSLVLGFLTMGIVFITYWTNNWTNNLAEPRQFDQADAYWLCKTMLARVSSDPGKAVIPHVESTEMGGNFHFAWSDGTQFLRLPNDSGFKAVATGSCTVDATRHNVTSLTVDGKVLR